MPSKIYNLSATAREKQKGRPAKPDESMPDSLNKSFYQKQNLWKRLVDVNIQIISQQAAETMHYLQS